MTVGSFVRWFASRRVICTLLGHRWTDAELPSRDGLVDGYECVRCETSRRNLWIWQNDPVDEDTENV